MNVKSKVENKEQYSVELVIEIAPEAFEAGLDRAYKKNRGSISVPGFRKGKAPRKIIEGMYGSGVFYQDAIEELYPAACEEAVEAEKLDIVAAPSIEIMEAGKEGLTFKAVFTIRPEVTLENYKGIEADKILPTIDDEMVEKELKTFVDRATRQEAVERPAQSGDTAIIDFEGFQNGIPFNGGKGENFDLVLGSGSFIPGFEEQVIGMSAGQEKEISVNFPEDYHAEELKGKPAVFKVKVLEVKAKIVPELDDEFAKDVSEFNTMKGLREDIRARVSDRAIAQCEAQFKQSVLDKLAEQVTIDLPAPMVEAQVDQMVDDYRHRLESQGISLEMYFSYMKMNEQMMRMELRPGAEKQLRTHIALDAVVKAEKIEVSDEAVAEEFKKIAENVKVSVEEVEAAISKENFKRDMARDKAMELVTKEAKAHMISEEEFLAKTAVEEVKKDEKKPAKKAATKTTTAKKTTAKEATTEKKTKTAASKKADSDNKEDGEAPAKKPRAKKTTATKEEGAEKAPKKAAPRKKAEPAGE